jgi:hypothetical protein
MGKKYFRFLSWVYVIGALLNLGIGVYAIVTGRAAEYLTKYYEASVTGIQKYDPRIILGIMVAIDTLIHLWLSWLVGRIGNGKSKGTFVMIIEILILAGNIYALFKIGFSIDTIVKTALALLTLIMVISARNGD